MAGAGRSKDRQPNGVGVLAEAKPEAEHAVDRALPWSRQDSLATLDRGRIGEYGSEARECGEASEPFRT